MLTGLHDSCSSLFLSDLTDNTIDGRIFFSDISKCASNPCLNNGKCVDKINSFNCSCLKGFTGNRCETGDRQMHAISDEFMNSWKNSLFPFLTGRVPLLQMSMNATVTRV